MQIKTIEISQDREKVLNGIKKVASTVGSTMGAQGKVVAIYNRKNGDLDFTKDGVSVAKAIFLEDPVENVGAQMIINSAEKTVEQNGDGTTATSVLLKGLLELNPDLTDFDKVIQNIREQSNKVKTVEEIRNIATVSSNSPELGDFIGNIYEECGMDTFISLELTDNAETSYEVVKGCEFNSGFLSQVFANTPQGNCVFEKPMIIIDRKKTTDYNQYQNAMQVAAKNQHPLVIISPDFSQEVVRFIVGNVQNSFPVCLIKAPGYGKQVEENFKDIEALMDSKNFVDKIVISPTNFIIYNQDTPDLETRIEEVKAQRDGFVEDYDIKRLQERLHMLQGTRAVIWAGGTTQKNASEEFDRIEDALGAVNAALRSGYVRGGGYALYDASRETSLDELGKVPLKTILNNAGLEFNGRGTELVGEVGQEFNVKTFNKEDFLKSGIIDPTDVVVDALVNARASYILFNNTQNIIINETEKRNQLFPG